MDVAERPSVGERLKHAASVTLLLFGVLLSLPLLLLVCAGEAQVGKEFE